MINTVSEYRSSQETVKLYNRLNKEMGEHGMRLDAGPYSFKIIKELTIDGEKHKLMVAAFDRMTEVKACWIGYKLGANHEKDVLS